MKIKKINLDVIPSNYNYFNDAFKIEHIYKEEYDDNDDWFDEELEYDCDLDYGYLEDEEDEEEFYNAITKRR